MKRLETFFIVRKSDLKPISKVTGFDMLFNRKFFGFFILGGWILSACLFILLSYSVLRHTVQMHQLNDSHENEVMSYICLVDSLNSVIDDNESLDSLMVRLFELITESPEKISHDKLWQYIKSCSPWYPDIIMMQAVQESNCGKSDVAKRTNNLFGMKKPNSRKWRCDKNRKNNKEQYMEFEDWRYSVIDRILWDRWLFRKYGRKPTIDEYMKAIDTVYNTETKGYSNSIYKNAAKYRKMMNELN